MDSVATRSRDDALVPKLKVGKDAESLTLAEASVSCGMQHVVLCHGHVSNGSPVTGEICTKFSHIKPRSRGTDLSGHHVQTLLLVSLFRRSMHSLSTFSTMRFLSSASISHFVLAC